MVAYSFKRQFVQPIRAGVKPHTMRDGRDRHARPGEQVQLYCGMRHKGCFLIARATCVFVDPVGLDFKRNTVNIGTRGPIAGAAELDAFAITDGFTGWEALRQFWAVEHPTKQEGWAGIIVGWKDLRDMGAPA